MLQNKDEGLIVNKSNLEPISSWFRSNGAITGL